MYFYNEKPHGDLNLTVSLLTAESIHIYTYAPCRKGEVFH